MHGSIVDMQYKKFLVLTVIINILRFLLIYGFLSVLTYEQNLKSGQSKILKEKKISWSL